MTVSTEKENANDNVVNVENVEEGEDSDLDKYWIRDLGLKCRDKHILRQCFWVNDRIIEAAHKLTRKKNTISNMTL